MTDDRFSNAHSRRPNYSFIEDQNDARTDLLNSKVNQLKHLAVQIGEETKFQNKLLKVFRKTRKQKFRLKYFSFRNCTSKSIAPIISLLELDDVSFFWHVREVGKFIFIFYFFHCSFFSLFIFLFVDKHFLRIDRENYPAENTSQQKNSSSSFSLERNQFLRYFSKSFD